MKTFWWALAALVIGVLIGHFLWPQAEEPTEPQPPPPSQWCQVPCGPSTACQLLTDIMMMAYQAKEQGQLGDTDFNRIRDLYDVCYRNLEPYGGKDPQHCQLVQNAHAAALQQNWSEVIDELDHGH